MDLKRILVAVNAVDVRDAAFERALMLARSAGAELYVLHAVPVSHPYSSGARERLERMRDLRRRAEDAGVPVQAAEQHGDPARLVELHANAREADLIVIGHEARRWWNRRSLTAERVIRRTDVPTLVVASDDGDGPASFRNVLVAVDLSPASKDILSRAIALTATEGVQVTAMHTVENVEPADAVRSLGRWMVPEYRTHVLEEARRALEAVVSPVPADIETRVQVSTGSASRAILEHAAATDADLIVVGRSQGFTMLGSTALRILRKNDRALLVIPGASRTRRIGKHAA
jgi:nucleotide-binding universal stress UspA family protein